MKHHFLITAVLCPFFLLQLSGCTFCNAGRPHEVNIADSIVGLQKVVLPFEYEDWLNWISDFYSDKGVEDENRFVYYYTEDHTWINEICKKDDKCKEITGFSHVFSPLFQILDNGNNDFYSFIVGSGENGHDALKLINVDNNGGILSSLNLSLQDTTSFVNGFCIMKDLKIKLYAGELVYDNVENRGTIKNRVSLEIYQLQGDGSLKRLHGDETQDNCHTNQTEEDYSAQKESSEKE